VLRFGHIKVVQGGWSLGTWKDAFVRWDTYENLDETLRKHLDDMKMNESELKEAFYKKLTFGTGGMRGVLGPGTNRMNIYTVRKAVAGLAKYLLEKDVGSKARGVVVAYDSRYMSKEFALECAKVLGYHGIKTYVFSSLRPTPLLSFAVRHLQTVAGIMITASHNPPEYNGFKVYNEDGGQMTLEESDAVINRVAQITDELTIPVLDEKELEKSGLLCWISSEIDRAYLEQLYAMSRMDEPTKRIEKDLTIVFTPLHGTAYHLVTEGLKQLQFNHLHVVEEQATIDPEFSTVNSPNPEEKEAFTLAIQLGKKVNADILLGTDPDTDRLGVAVKDQSGDYQVLTGNQLGSLLLDYILHQYSGQSLTHARMLKTIVTKELSRKIAEDYGVKTVNTLTGFKFISEKIRQYDTTGETFIFGFEESYGYLIDSFSRDKDAIQAAVMTAEMAYAWKKRGKSLLDALDQLYETYGYYLEGMTQLTLEGIEGTQKIEAVMDYVRKHPFQQIANLRVQAIEDYLKHERISINDTQVKEVLHLPKENALKFILTDDCWVCLRPSETEPKLKCYYGVKGSTREECERILNELQGTMEQSIKKLI